MKKVELLAPAKNKEIAIDAINFGADAVYIAARAFSARSDANNSIEDIAKVVEHAHRYNARVYVPMNTLLRDDELEAAVKQAHELYHIGVDALIIQDLGLLECDLPPIALHASTQMHNDTLEKIQFLESVGFKRVVLPREFSKQQIEQVSQSTQMEIEAFAHGSLCVCYSGQCYLSYSIGKRSSNRGECAQPCRKKYSITDETGKSIKTPSYLLSLKDLNLSKNLKEMLEAGVNSFKIEGRLKNAEYVRNVVAYYRKALDAAMLGTEYEKSSLGKVSFDFEPDLYKTFNRGYTDYFFNKRTRNITNFDTQKSLGEPLGNIIELSKKGFKLDKDVEFVPGDGICFFDSKNELLGTPINAYKDSYATPKSFYGLELGTFIYRNYNHEFAKKLLCSRTERLINVDVKVFSEGKCIVIEAIDEAENIERLMLKNTFELATDYENALATMKKQLSKFGGTIFHLNSLKINLDTTPFISVKELNEWRRQLLSGLLAKRVPVYETKSKKIERNTIEYPIKEIDFKGNVVNEKARKFFAIHSTKVKERGAEAGTKLKGKTLMTCKHCLRYSLNKCLKICSDKSDWYLIDEKNSKYKLDFDCENCVMNVIY